MYLLDTNVVSELRRVRPHRGVLNWIDSIDPHRIFVSAVTIGEIQAGIELIGKHDTAKAAEIEKWLNQIEGSWSVLAMDSRAFREWARLLHSNDPAHSEDIMIAATARVHGLTVATRNERDFKGLGVDIVDPWKTKI